MKMSTIDQILVSLDGSSGQDILIKKTLGSYMEKPVKTLVEYMLDPSGDSSNPGYNQSEREVVAMINGWIEEAKSNPNEKKFIVAAKPVNGGDPIQLDPGEKVSAYESRIVSSRSLPGGDSSVLSPYIELFARIDRKSGMGRVLYLIQTNHQENGR